MYSFLETPQMQSVITEGKGAFLNLVTQLDLGEGGTLLTLIIMKSTKGANRKYSH